MGVLTSPHADVFNQVKQRLQEPWDYIVDRSATARFDAIEGALRQLVRVDSHKRSIIAMPTEDSLGSRQMRQLGMSLEDCWLVSALPQSQQLETEEYEALALRVVRNLAVVRNGQLQCDYRYSPLIYMLYLAELAYEVGGSRIAEAIGSVICASWLHETHPVAFAGYTLKHRTPVYFSRSC